jgi:hypothetical protein
MKSFRNKVLSVLALLALLQLGGCATFEFTKPAPTQQQPITLRVSGEELSGWTDLPLGVYRVPDSHVVISGHQKGQVAGLLFGLVGVAIAHAANASAGADTVKSAEQQLRMKLNDQVEASIQRIVAAEPFQRQFIQADRAGSAKLLLTPALVLSFIDESSVRPFVVIRARMVGTDGKPQWNTRYIASSGESRPLLGPDGWLENDAVQLKKSVQGNLDRAMQTLAVDVTRPYPRDESKLTTVQGNFPYVKSKLQSVGFQLGEDEQYLTFVPKLGDVIVFSGVNIFDKKFIVHRPATKEDLPLKLVDEAPAKK